MRLQPIILAPSRSPWERYKILFLFLGLLLLAFLYTRLPPRLQGIAPREARVLIQSPETVVIDVRRPGRYRSGHLPGAQSVPLKQFPSYVSRLPQDHTKPILIYSEWGVKSAGICERLMKRGYSRVYNLIGGMKTWRNLHQPLETGEPPITR